jgi:hypothetical protein
MIILAPTGTAAALLGGFTYHSILGIIAVCSKVGGHVLFPFLTHFDG